MRKHSIKKLVALVTLCLFLSNNSILAEETGQAIITKENKTFNNHKSDIRTDYKVVESVKIARNIKSEEVPSLQENQVATKETLPTEIASDIEDTDSIEEPTLEKEGLEEDVPKDVPPDHWAYSAVKELTAKYDILEGMPDGMFDGQRSATRYEMAQALAQLLSKMDDKHSKMTAIEKAAIKSLKEEFDKEILTLAARIEKTEVELSKFERSTRIDIENLSADVAALAGRHHFRPEFRLNYSMGDPEAISNARVRMNSATKLDDKTVAVLRIESMSNNFINRSEELNEITDVELRIAYMETSHLTSWIPEKLGKITFMGGVMPTYWPFFRGYRAAVDQRAFTDANYSYGLFNTHGNSFMRTAPDGRNISIGGEYVKDFCKYKGQVRASAMRSTGGSLNRPIGIYTSTPPVPASDFNGIDVASSGDESTFYAVTGKMEVPIKEQPVEFRLSHYQSFDDANTSMNNYSIGGKISTKFDGFGVLKGGLIGYNGSMPPRLLGGYGGKGFSYQFSFAPTIRAFGDFFGDPDLINHETINYVPKKTEFIFAFADYENRQDEKIRVLDIGLTRYLTSNIFGRVMFEHIMPTTNNNRLDHRSSVIMETIFKL